MILFIYENHPRYFRKNDWFDGECLICVSYISFKCPSRLNWILFDNRISARWWFSDIVYPLVSQGRCLSIGRWKKVSLGKLSRSTSLSGTLRHMYAKFRRMFLDAFGRLQQVHSPTSTSTGATTTSRPLNNNRYRWQYERHNSYILYPPPRPVTPSRRFTCAYFFFSLLQFKKKIDFRFHIIYPTYVP